MTLKTGDKAPAFDLPTDGGGTLTLGSLKGKKVVLYFYPKDSTPGCTTEANDFTDRIKDFEKAGCVVVGASKDSVKRHDNFKAKQAIAFPLLSDEDGTLCNDYGVWVQKKLYGREYMGIERATFLIDAQGRIARAWRNVKVADHAAAKNADVGWRDARHAREEDAPAELRTLEILRPFLNAHAAGDFTHWSEQRQTAIR